MLNQLHIQNFRSLQDFHVPQLGRVNLIVGKNNSGKSSILEAVRIYAGAGQREFLEQIAQSHDERYYLEELEYNSAEETLPFQEFFTRGDGNHVNLNKIIIGEQLNGNKSLTMEFAKLREHEQEIADATGNSKILRQTTRVDFSTNPINTDDRVIRVITVTKSGLTNNIFIDVPNIRINTSMHLVTERCGVVPTRFVSSNELAREWDSVVFTESENLMRKALQHIVPEFEGLAFVESGEFGPRTVQVRPERLRRRVPRVKMSRVPGSVPMNSLGDGFSRVFQLALKIFSAKGGFLLIDEFENGLHYSVQDNIWTFVFDMALAQDIQIFATTHSWDCIESFARVSGQRKEIDAILFRVGRSVRKADQGKVIATVFDAEQLATLTQSELEVR